MNKHLKTLVIVFLFYAIYFILDSFLFKDLRINIHNHLSQIGLSHVLTYLITGIPLYIAVMILHPPKNFFDSWGLNRSVLRGFIIALICTLPMFTGFAFLFKWNSEVTINQLLIAVIAAAVFEELFIRSFLFGQVFRYTRLGFIPSVLAGAVLFACMHLYQSQDIDELVGIFAITFMGAILFGWLYTEWNYNIWVPIFLHLLMNLAWLVFTVSDNVLGNTYANIFRFTTVGMAIAGTIIYKRKKRIPLAINKRTIWMK